MDRIKNCVYNTDHQQTIHFENCWYFGPGSKGSAGRKSPLSFSFMLLSQRYFHTMFTENKKEQEG